MQQPEWSLMSRKKLTLPLSFIRLHWLPIAARIKFKVLMFAYKTTTGTAPIYLNSLVQLMRPPEACVLQVNDVLWCHPKEVPNHSHGPLPGLCPAGGMTSRISIPTAESLAIFKKHLKTHLFSPAAPD